MTENSGPSIPDWLKPREYQLEAIRNWKDNDYCGIFSMATGTGKTLTAILSWFELKKSKDSFLTLIICPYVNLVEQWADELEKFNFQPIICFSKHINWKNKASTKISQVNRGIDSNPVFIISNSSFVLDDFQEIINKCKKDILIIVDEAHYAGAENVSNYLDNRFIYRLGLTATPNRHFDDAGTSFIMSYFKKEVFSYDLKKAIDSGFLTKYYYYPIKVYLTNEEFFTYQEFSEKIAKIGTKDLNESQLAYKEILLQKRSKILQAASNKYDALRSVTQKYMNEHNILVYCGSVDSSEEDSKSQIKSVCSILGNEFGMSLAKYTYEESIEERKRILERFEKDSMLQALVAIKCLDEGIDIPSVQTAIIFSSSSNPKEYIQRRGRVLRKSEGKEFSNIIDFVVVPPKAANFYEYENAVGGIVSKELSRVSEFGSIAINANESIDFIASIKNEFGVTTKDGGKNG